MNKIKPWLGPFFVTLVLALFVVGSTVLYNQVRGELYRSESSIVGKAIALDLVNEIRGTTQDLRGINLIESVGQQNKYELYEKIAKRLYEQYPDFFYAINYISPTGLIERVFPYKGNELALGRNVIERPELEPYLIQARDLKKTTMSPRVLTYQGIYAVIIYEPVFDKKGQFKGWLNALINIDSWVKKQIESEGWKHIYLNLNWIDVPLNDLELGEKKADQIFTYQFKLLNQKVEMKVGQVKSDLNLLHRKLLYLMEGIGGFLVALISFLLFKLTASQIKLQSTNQQLDLKNILLNSLTHDASSPLTALSFSLERGPEDQQKVRARLSLKTLNEMLESVRSLSRLELEKDLKLHPVQLKKTIDRSLLLIQERSESKNVKIIQEGIDPDFFVCADESTLIHNVIPNVLNNAIKFTKPHSRVFLRSEKKNGFIWLIIADEGRGFSDDEIKSFNEGKALKSTKGTEGETGSGLGLTQVKGFMLLYGGLAKIENTELGAMIKLRFKAFSGPLP
jgi:signal transduction histidine kinase